MELTQRKIDKMEVADPTANFAKLVARILLKFDIKNKRFIDLLKRHLVLEAIKLYPEYKKVDLSVRTGIDRRFIDKYSKTGKDYTPNVHEKESVIMNWLISYCRKNDTKRILKRGPFQTFDSICKRCANGSLTTESVAKELIRQGKIVDDDDCYIVNIDRSFSSASSDVKAFNCLNREINNVLNAINWNMEVENESSFKQEDKADIKLVQRSIKSTTIPVKYHPEVEAKIKCVNEFAYSCHEHIIAQYESPTAQDGQEPEIGSSITSISMSGLGIDLETYRSMRADPEIFIAAFK
ncbi:hypothetical protein [Marinicella sp. W31]|uniref:hypothetical protein n=1 Tax=Marinicella sp. W31 TaxID=3023713 RepID=UPI003756BD3B